MFDKEEANSKNFIKFWLVPLGIVLAIFVIFKAMTGLIIIGVAIFLALALQPLVRKMEALLGKITGSKKDKNTSSSILAYLIVIAMIGVVLGVIGPVMVSETTKFIQNLPTAFEETVGGWEGINNFGNAIGIENLQEEVKKGIEELPGMITGVLGENILSGVSGVADAVMRLMLILVLTLLFMLEGPAMMREFWGKMEKRKGKKVTDSIHHTISRMARVISTFVSRQIMMGILDGCATIVIVFILSLIFGFSSTLAIPMGMITMLFYLIPMFGQFIGGTLVTLMIFISNPIAALIFAIIYIVYAQIENNFIAPKVQGDALKLRPVLILSAIVIGTYMFGLIGAILAIPVAGCIKVILEERPNIKKAREENAKEECRT